MRRRGGIIEAPIIMVNNQADEVPDEYKNDPELWFAI